MSKVTIEVEPSTLSPRGQEAFRTLMEELSMGVSGAPVASGTVEQLAEKLYDRMARKKSMKTLLDALLDNKKAQLTLKDIEDKVGLKGSSLAGVLSSMTRNLKRYHKVGKPTFFAWDDLSNAYQLYDPALLAPLIKARRQHKRS